MKVGDSLADSSEMIFSRPQTRTDRRKSGEMKGAPVGVSAKEMEGGHYNIAPHILGCCIVSLSFLFSLKKIERQRDSDVRLTKLVRCAALFLFCFFFLFLYMYIPLQSHLYCSLSSFLHVWNSQLFYLKQKFCWVRCVTCFVHPHSSGAFAWIYWTEKEPSNGHTKGKEEKKKENKEEFISLSLLSFSDSIRLFRAL